MARAVDAAEERTGLQFCVYLGPVDGDPHRFAEDLFTKSGLADRPGVLLLVAPKEHYVEVLTSPEARTRVPDEACRAAVARMVEDFTRKRVDRGIVHGVDYLAEVAGPGNADAGAVELPDVLG